MTNSGPQTTDIQVIIGTDEEISDLLRRFKRLKRHEGMKLPNGTSHSRDDLIRLLSIRDPSILVLVEMYRVKKKDVTSRG